MATSISFCLKPSSLQTPPIPSPPSHFPSKKSRIEATKGQVIKWRSEYVAIAACIVIGSTTGIASINGDAGASEGPRFGVEATASEGRVRRWSDRIRKCPPWHQNSLENVMPENLPRPSGGRRSEGYAAYDQTAPRLGSSIQYNNSCYSL